MGNYRAPLVPIPSIPPTAPAEASPPPTPHPPPNAVPCCLLSRCLRKWPTSCGRTSSPPPTGNPLSPGTRRGVSTPPSEPGYPCTRRWPSPNSEYIHTYPYFGERGGDGGGIPHQPYTEPLLDCRRFRVSPVRSDKCGTKNPSAESPFRVYACLGPSSLDGRLHTMSVRPRGAIVEIVSSAVNIAEEAGLAGKRRVGCDATLSDLSDYSTNGLNRPSRNKYVGQVGTEHACLLFCSLLLVAATLCLVPGAEKAHDSNPA